MAEKYVCWTKITGIEERFDRLWISGVGAEAIFENRASGWFVTTTDGTFGFGLDKPDDLKPGLIVEISFQAIEGDK